MRLFAFFPLFAMLSFQTLGAQNTEQPARPKDVQGWTDARWGMTRSEIWKLFPHAEPSISSKYLVLKGIEIDKEPFSAEFRFADAGQPEAGLTAVILSAERRPVPVNGLFESLQKLLATKYGPADYVTPPNAPPTSVGRVISMRWDFPSTTISLNGLTGLIATVTISYKQNTGDGLDKL